MSQEQIQSRQSLLSMLFYPLLFLMAVIAGWRALIFLGIFSGQEEIWADTYAIVALLGACMGLLAARYWGGTKSYIGKAIIFFSVGLFLQFFGQAVYAYYAIFLEVEAAYPSLGDIGFFGSIPAYILGIIFLARVSGIKFSFRSIKNQILGVLVPLLILAGSYWFFLREYEPDWSSTLVVLLDFGYPLGQALYLSIAVLTLLLSRNYLGGVMKRPLLVLIVALLFQYFSDFIFLYRFSQDAYTPGGITDILYFLAYCVMGLSLFYFGIMLQRIKSKQ